MSKKSWNLVADIGGTNARFGLVEPGSERLQCFGNYSVGQFHQFHQALQSYLNQVSSVGQWCDAPATACLAVACTVTNDELTFTNSPWSIQREQLSRQLQGTAIDLINDFSAVGHAVAALQPEDWCQVGGQQPLDNKPIAILGPGTGLGVSTLIPVGRGYRVIEGEGGHVDFAPVNSEEIALLEILSRRFGRVSAERLLSGNGLVNIHMALAEMADTAAVYRTPREITDAALHRDEAAAVKALSIFCQVLGAVAGNLALTIGGRGGVYIAGGIVPRFIEFLQASDFRQRFEAKGRFKTYLSSIPVRVVTKDNLGLHGAVKKLSCAEVQ